MEESDHPAHHRRTERLRESPGQRFQEPNDLVFLNQLSLRNAKGKKFRPERALQIGGLGDQGNLVLAFHGEASPDNLLHLNFQSLRAPLDSALRTRKISGQECPGEYQEGEEKEGGTGRGHLRAIAEPPRVRRGSHPRLPRPKRTCNPRGYGKKPRRSP